MPKEHIKSYVGSHKLALASITYFLISALLSLTIFLRLLVLPIEPIKYANAILYYLEYIILPLSAGIILIPMLLLLFPKVKAQKRIVRYSLVISVITSMLAIEFSFLLIGIPDYISLFLSIPIFAALYIAKVRHKTNQAKRKIAVLLTLVISISFVLPPVITYLSYQNVLLQTSNKTDSDKASFVSGFILTVNTNSQVFGFMRLGNNFQRYLMTGVGACGEMAFSTTTFLRDIGLDSQIVTLPGEDHAFVEVKLNETWFVLDPGYFGSEIWTRTDRAVYRIINETTIGAVTYVMAHKDSSFVELTQNYVPTDTMAIRIVDKGEPVASIPVYLAHQFHGRINRLPDAQYSFYTDVNGTIHFHLGNTTYSELASNTESFYKIFVNDINTGQTVSSTGTNQTKLIQIDLSEL